MPIVSLPDGRELEFPDGMSNEAMASAIHSNFPEYAPKQDAPTEHGDLYRGAKNSLLQVPQLAYGLEAGAGAIAEKAFGEGGISTAIKNQGVEGYKDWGDKVQANSKETDSFTTSWDKAKQGDLGALVDLLQYGIGYAGGQGLQLLATGGIGGIVAKSAGVGASKLAAGMVAKESAKILEQAAGRKLGEHELEAQAAKFGTEKLTKEATARAATTIGKTAIVGAQAFGMEGGEIYGDMVSQAAKDGKELSGEDLARAFGATLAAGGLEFVGDKLGLDVMIGKSKLVGGLTKATGATGTLARGAVAGVGTAAAEGATEFSQTIAEEYGKGNDPFTESGWRNIWDSAALGALGGATMGGVGGALHKPAQAMPDANIASDVSAESNSLAVDASELIDTASTVDNIQSQTTTDGAIKAAAEALNSNRKDVLSASTGFGGVDELATLAAQEKADIEKQRANIVADQQHTKELRLNSDIESTDNRVAGAQQAETRNARLSALDTIYASQDRTPGMSFLNHIEENYPNNPLPTPEEKAIIAKRESGFQAFKNSADQSNVDEAPTQDPNAPKPTDVQIAKVDDFLAKGYVPSGNGKMLVSQTGKKFILNATQRKYVKNLPNVATETAPKEPDFDAPESKWVKYRADYDKFYGKEDLTPVATEFKSIEKQKSERADERQAEKNAEFKLIPIAVRRAVDYKSERIALGIDGNNGTFNNERDASDGSAYAKFTRNAKARSLNALKRYETDSLNKFNSQNKERTSFSNRVTQAKKKPKASTLLTTLRDLGGVSQSSKADVVGDKFAPGGYNQVFKKDAKNSIESHVGNGELDEFLPYELRFSTQDQSGSEVPDMQEAAEWIKDKIRGGERVLPYDVQMELDQKEIEAQHAIAEIEEEYSNEERTERINAELQIAAAAESEARQDARIFDTENETSTIASGPRTQSGESAAPSATQQENVTTGVTTPEAPAFGLTSYSNAEVLKREAAANKPEEAANKEPPAKHVTADQFILPKQNPTGISEAASASGKKLDVQPTVGLRNNIEQQDAESKDEATKAKAAIHASELTPAEKLKTLEALGNGAITPEDVHAVVGKPAQAITSKFGKVFTEFHHDAKGAIAKLMQEKSGDAVGALSHPEVGDIDLVWGDAGKAKSDGYGLAKIIKFHPEVIGSLQSILDGMKVKSRSSNRIRLESENHEVAVSLNWLGVNKTWLLTAYKKRGADAGATMDTANTSGKDDTASLAISPEVSVEQQDAESKKSNPSDGDGKSNNAPIDDFGEVISESKETDIGTALFSQARKKSEGMTVESVKLATAKLRARWLGFKRIEIVQSVRGIPNDIYLSALRALKPIDQGTEGIYDPMSRKVYLIADNIATADRAVWVAVHEVVGHGGIRMLGGTVAEAVDRAAKNPYVTKLAKAIATDRGEDFESRTHTDEAMAELSAASVTGNVDSILNRYGVKVPTAMRNNLLGMIKRVLEALRSFMAKVMGKPVTDVSDSDIHSMLMRMNSLAEGHDVSGADSGLSHGSAQASRGRQSAESFARMALEELSAENDQVFAHKVSNSNTIDGVVLDVVKGARFIGEDTRQDERAESHADRRYLFKTQNGKKFEVYETDAGEVWINVSYLEPGSGGQSIYAAVANYAYNTHQKFVGDPFGLSQEAVIRRTSNMLSSALRFGTTRHLEAAQQQVWGSPEEGVAPLHWNGSDVDKVEALIHTFVATAENFAPSLKEYYYDFQTAEFSDAHSKPVTGAAMAENTPRDAGIGEKTARRVALLRSLLSADSETVSGGRSGILEQLLRWGDTYSPGSLHAIFSRTAQGDDVHGDRAENAESKSETLDSPALGHRVNDDEAPLVSRSSSRQSSFALNGNAPTGSPTKQTNINLSGGQVTHKLSWNTLEPSKFDDIVYKLIDKNIDLKRVIEAVNATGAKLAEKFNPYLAEELYHGRSDKRIKHFINTELKPLLAEMRRRGVKQDALNDYLWARHAKEANALIASRDPSMQDGGSGMTNKEADDYLNGLKPETKKSLEVIAKRVDRIITESRELYASYGLVSKDQVDEWANMFKHYVPLMREDHDGGMGVGQGFSVKGKEVKHRTGSGAKVVDILANIALQREKVIVRGEKNRVAVALAGLVKMNPNPDFWTFGKVPTERVLNEKTGLVEERIDPIFKSRSNAIVAKIKDSNGDVHERAIIFNEHNDRAMRMAEALKNLDAIQLGGLLSVSAKVTRYFASINTQYNPVFGVTNIVRDMGGMALNLSSTPIAGHRFEVLKHIPSALAGIYSDLRAIREGRPATSKWAHLWEEMQNEGGMTGYRDLYRNSEDRARAIERELDPHGWTETKWGKAFTAGGALKVPLIAAQHIAGPLFDWLSDYNQAMEGATRLAVYKVAREKGMSKQNAASLSKNITVNFNRKGQLGKQAGALYAFFNASMQGTARSAETMFTMKNGDIKTLRLSPAGKVILYGGILLGAMQALLLSAAGFDDDEPPEFVRERNLILPLPFSNKKYLTLPMPLGFNAIPNIGRVATEWALGGFKDPAKHAVSLISVFVDAFNPIGGSGTPLQILSPTGTDPLASLAENKDWKNQSIYRDNFNSLNPTPGFTRNKDTATYLSKVIAEGFNTLTGGDDYKSGMFSPTADQIDYLFGQVTGGVGREVSKAWQAGQSSITGEELPAYKIPLLGRFYGNEGDQSSEGGHFYKNIIRINEVKAGLAGRIKDRKPTSEFKSENPEYKLIPKASYAKKRIHFLRAKKRDLIEKNSSREKIKAVEDDITKEMKRLNEAVKKMKQAA